MPQAIERGLVDAIGGISTAVAIAKQAAGMNEDEPVRVVEVKPVGGFGGASAAGASVALAMEALQTGKEMLQLVRARATTHAGKLPESVLVFAQSLLRLGCLRSIKKLFTIVWSSG